MGVDRDFSQSDRRSHLGPARHQQPETSRFDGEQIQALKRSGHIDRELSLRLLDPGIFRIEFKSGNSGWYFVSDDRRFITPVTISTWIKFSQVISVDASKTRALKKFPEDLVGTKWNHPSRQMRLQLHVDRDKNGTA